MAFVCVFVCALRLVPPPRRVVTLESSLWSNVNVVTINVTAFRCIRKNELMMMIIDYKCQSSSEETLAGKL